uniref:Uncharacterized protein n=1 Tax=Brassica campestris TaxID=3711 RepID=M4D217_BRACM
MMASFVSASSPKLYFSFRELPPSSSTRYPRRFEVSERRFSIKCSSSDPEDAVDSAPSLSSSTSSSTSEVFINSPRYKWFTVLGGIEMLDTAYLTYLKLTGSDVFCPVGGGTCSDVLNSDYALVFG